MFYSPLRYPGGKGKLEPFMELLIKQTGHQGGVYVEPFAGGAGIALELLEKEVVHDIVINDLDKGIYSFWKPLAHTKLRYDTNFEDDILDVSWNESELENDDLKNYKAKAEYYIREHQDNEAIKKLKSNIPLSHDDIEAPEKVLWSELGTKEEYEQEYGSKPLGELVREIVGLDMNAAKAAFSEYLESNNLDSRQIYFVNQIVEYIVHNGMMKDLSVLQESPFTDQGSVVEIFTDLNVWMEIRKVIESINDNAIAA